jgi:hypothetical protein
VTYSYDRRVKKAGITDSEALDVDDAEGTLQGIVSSLRKYHRVCAVLPPVYRKIADALETKDIFDLATKVEDLCKKVADFGEFVAKNTPAVRRFEKEFDHMVEKMAGDIWFGPKGAIEAVHSLPAARLLYSAGQEFDTLKGALDDSGIDWSLDDYLGYEAKIYKRLTKVAPEPLEDVIPENPFYGVLNYYMDPPYIKDRVDELRDEA